MPDLPICACVDAAQALYLTRYDPGILPGSVDYWTHVNVCLDSIYQANHKRLSLATSNLCAPCIMACVFTALYGICMYCNNVQQQQPAALAMASLITLHTWTKCCLVFVDCSLSIVRLQDPSAFSMLSAMLVCVCIKTLLSCSRCSRTAAQVTTS